MILALVVVACCIAVLVLALVAFGLRRRVIQRSGGTFDCSLRLHPVSAGPTAAGTAAEGGGKGWVYGVARYSSDRIEWFRVFSYALRPRHVLERAEIGVLHRRTPMGEEELALLDDSVVLACTHRGEGLELAMSDDALTGFLAWLEAAPPGQRVNVA
ncbi:DUF2550 domain-containing protein [Streptomyces sp. NPDC059506]|uniref:DUF2550 domain-containing protein n=1 Tax=Streptomyces thermolineatus TaxID=44033 RepID=A0ABN3KV55_9ACTN|nr:MULTISPECIES: DUF2550 domain-containing protein [unclassified Streptomyces]MCZ2524253.1 DUF2550 domain-containing protein [Streptomyces sp. HB2AG]PLW71109.1 DUF2550 domain-containing protein [Streptomyces sp. DJ]QMV21724.1 DUF2550 family protein [Streptomyces sp. SCUT-3]